MLPTRDRRLGTKHLQMYFQTASKIEPKKFTDFLTEHLGVRPHVEGAKGSSEQCVDYCSKEDTRDPGTETIIINPQDYVEIASSESRQGAREDLEAVRVAIHDGASLDTLIAEHFDTFARYDRFLRQYYTDHHQRLVHQQLIDSTSGTSLSTWQTTLLTKVTGPPPSPQNILVVGIDWRRGQIVYGTTPCLASRRHPPANYEEGRHAPSPDQTNQSYNAVRCVRFDKIK